MSYVKALYGHVIGDGLSLSEGQIGYVENDFSVRELEKRGIVKIFATAEEADAFKFKSSQELFMESYQSLNPPLDKNGNPVSVSASTIDWDKSAPLVTDGVPSNYIVETPVDVPVVKSVKVDPLQTPASDSK